MPNDVVDQDTKFNFSKICRWCSKESTKLQELYLYQLSENVLLVDFVRDLSGIKVTKNDGLPEQMCLQCVKTIRNAFDFIQDCIQIDILLRQQRNRIAKQENVNNKASLKEGIHLQGGSLEAEILDSCADDEKSDFDESGLVESSSTKTDKYKCSKCPISFNNKTKYKSHLKIHDKKPFKCNECLQTFSRLIYLNVHCRSHIKPENKRFVCKTCGQQFTYEYLLKQHEYKHKDEKPFPCSKCTKGCLTAENLRRHMRIHEENYLKKTHCCRICSNKFAYPSALTEHMKHHTGEKPHLCSTCGKGFRQTGALHYHQRTHTDFKPFTCAICSVGFRSQSSLKVHMRKHTNERPYVCNICGMAFRQPTHLKSHYRKHSGERSAVCPVCDKRLYNTGQLNVHLRIHTGEKPFKCDHCNKDFTTNTSLIKHKRIHTGERPYVCSSCGKAFNQIRTLKTHSLTHRQESGVSKKATVDTKVDQVVVFKEEDANIFKEEIISDTEQVIKQEEIIIEEHKEEYTVILSAPIPSLHAL